MLVDFNVDHIVSIKVDGNQLTASTTRGISVTLDALSEKAALEEYNKLSARIKGFVSLNGYRVRLDSIEAYWGEGEGNRAKLHFTTKEKGGIKYLPMGSEEALRESINKLDKLLCE